MTDLAITKSRALLSAVYILFCITVISLLCIFGVFIGMRFDFLPLVFIVLTLPSYYILENIAATVFAQILGAALLPFWLMLVAWALVAGLNI